MQEKEMTLAQHLEKKLRERGYSPQSVEGIEGAYPTSLTSWGLPAQDSVYLNCTVKMLDGVYFRYCRKDVSQPSLPELYELPIPEKNTKNADAFRAAFQKADTTRIAQKINDGSCQSYCGHPMKILYMPATQKKFLRIWSNAGSEDYISLQVSQLDQFARIFSEIRALLPEEN